MKREKDDSTLTAGRARLRKWGLYRHSKQWRVIRILVALFAVALMADVAAAGPTEVRTLEDLHPSLLAPSSVATVRVLDEQGQPAAGSLVELWKNMPNNAGVIQPVEVASFTTNAQGLGSAVDPAAPSAQIPAGSVQNYIVTAQYLPGTSQVQGAEYAWTASVGSSGIQATSITLQTQRSSLPPSPSGTSSGLVPARNPPFCFGETYVGSGPADEVTMIGEEHSTVNSEQTQFTYGTDSGSSLTVYANANGGGWSVSGSVTITVGSSQTTTWPYLSNNTGWILKSKFGYYWYETNWNTNNPIGCIPPVSNTYPWTAEPSTFLSGSFFGSNVVGYNDACASWVTGGSEGQWTQFAGGPGSSYDYSESNGVQYSLAASVTLDSIKFGFSDTSSYNSHQSEHFSWPESGVNYYVYTGPVNTSWPAETAYLSTSTLTCGGGCVAVDTPILLATGRYVPVQDLRQGSYLTGFDVVSGKVVDVRLTSIAETSVQSLIDINHGALLLTPTDQPIFVQNSTFVGWLQNPDQLVPGDAIFQPLTHEWIPVTNLTIEQGNVEVYDVTTSGPNDFIANGYLLDRKA